MPQASTEVLAKFTEFAKEELHDHGILQGIAHNIIHENYHVSRGGIISKRNKEYRGTDKERYAIMYLVQEWDYAWSETE